MNVLPTTLERIRQGLAPLTPQQSLESHTWTEYCRMSYSTAGGKVEEIFSRCPSCPGALKYERIGGSVVYTDASIPCRWL